jgi:hypothetical protein
MPYRSHLARLCFVFIGGLGVLAPTASAFELHGFADVSYQHDIHDNDVEENNGAFAIGPVDFYVAESLSPRVDVLAEIAFESGIVDLERLQIGYLFSDALKVYAGRFHTSLGYWNTAYHHGAFLHTTIQRPFFLHFEDEGGILPVHSVGLLFSGRRFSGAGELAYSALVGNGSSIIDEDGTPVLDPNNEGDPTKNKAVGLRATFTPAPLLGLTLGASAYNSRVLDERTPVPAIDVTQTILGVDLTFLDGPTEILAEYFLVRDKDELGTTTAKNHMYYLQIGREFADRVMPYARHEQMSLDEADPYLSELNAIDKRIETVGIRVRVGDQSALKFEGRFITDDGSDSHQEYGAQWAFAF